MLKKLLAKFKKPSPPTPGLRKVIALQRKDGNPLEQIIYELRHILKSLERENAVACIDGMLDELKKPGVIGMPEDDDEL